MTQNYRPIILLLISVGCLAAAGSGQAQTNVPQAAAPQETEPQGPIRLEGVGPFYTLKLVEVADTKPAEYVWLLQSGNQETAYKSLNAVSLRSLVSRLPSGASVFCTTNYLPGSNPTTRVDISSYPSFNDFAAFCRSKGIHFEFGTSF